RDATVSPSRAQRRVSKSVLPRRATSTRRGRVLRNSTSCRSSSGSTSRLKLTRGCKGDVTESTYFSAHTPSGDAGSHSRVLQTRKDRDRKEQRAHLPSGETRSEIRRQHPRVPPP